MIFGLPGSGKSTFAQRLGKLIDLPVYHLDRYFFVENWQERDYPDFMRIQQGFVDQDKWIIDGNSIKSLSVRYKRADAVIYFHYNRWVCITRLFKRLFVRDPLIQDLADGCSSTVRMRLITYLWGFDDRVKDTIDELRRRYPNTDFFVFHNDKEAENFFNQFSLD